MRENSKICNSAGSKMIFKDSVPYLQSVWSLQCETEKCWTVETEMIDVVKITFWPRTFPCVQKSNSHLNWLQPVTRIVAQSSLKQIYHRGQVFMVWLIQINFES